MDYKIQTLNNSVNKSENMEAIIQIRSLFVVDDGFWEKTLKLGPR